MAKKKSTKKTSAKYWYVLFIALIASLTLFYVAIQRNNSNVLGSNISNTKSYRNYPTPVLRNPVSGINLDTPCKENGFVFATYKCLNKQGGILGNPSKTCNSAAIWYQEIRKICEKTPTPSIAKPTCGTCPQFSPPVNYCPDGTIVITKDACGCPSGLKCLDEK